MKYTINDQTKTIEVHSFDGKEIKQLTELIKKHSDYDVWFQGESVIISSPLYEPIPYWLNPDNPPLKITCVDITASSSTEFTTRVHNYHSQPCPLSPN